MDATSQLRIPELVHQEVGSEMKHKIYLNEKEMTAVINVFRVYEVTFRAGLMRAEVGNLAWSLELFPAF